MKNKICSFILQIELLQQLKVRVNGRDVTLPYLKLGHISIIQRGHALFMTTNIGLSIVWDGLSYLEVCTALFYVVLLITT